MRILIAILMLAFMSTTILADGKTPAKVPDVSQDQLVKKYSNDLKNISQEQRATLNKIAKLASGFDLSYAAAAIAWQESNLGKYPVNLSDPSCGVFHKLVVPYLKARERKVTSFTKNQACSELISDLELATSSFLEDFEYWKNMHRRRGVDAKDLFTLAIRSYNTGYKYNTKDGKNYERSVKARIKALQQDLRFQIVIKKITASKK